MSESNMQNTHSPYTPTTEEVQRAYRNSEYGGPDTEFDRWIAEVKAQAWLEGNKAGMAYFIEAHYNPYRQGEEQ